MTELEGKISMEENADKVNELKEQVTQQQLIISQQEELRKKWKEENERRRHNFVPLIFELMAQFAKKDMLAEMVDDA